MPDPTNRAQPAPEPTFTPEEVELHSAPWSYLQPLTVDPSPPQTDAS